VLRRAYVELDERALQEIAERSGGRYFHAEDAGALAEVYDEIDALERSEIVEVRYMQYEEHYAAFAGIGLGLILAGTLVAESLLRRLP
jgi:Ca-activated chloride channel family protein